MIFSFKKLKELASLPKDITLEKVLNAINSIGFEVEDVKDFGIVSGVKFGKVIKVYKNPNGDKLSVCEIQFNDKKRIIQTTADNMKEDMIVLALVPGSTMNGITFGEKELKGIVSEGMLTSLEEFGIAKENVREEMFDKITDYKDESLLATDPIEYLQLNDKLIDIDILSNRSDANSYYVMAIELAAYFGVQISLPILKESKIESNIIVNNGEAKSLVMFEAKKDFEITIPEMILLGKSNIKSINDIVDLTNLTLIMSGQPTHAYLKKNVNRDFKAKKVSGKFVLFGNKHVELDNNLVITSGSKPVSVAGVIGLEDFAVKENDDFIIELGIFNIKDIRNSIKAVKLNNMASSQSSKILSLGTTELALRYLSNKLNIFSKFINFQRKEVNEVAYSNKVTSMLAGFEITKEEKFGITIDKLELLGYKFLLDKVIVPSYRHDVHHQQDIDEEIFRFYGYDSFKPIAPKNLAHEISDIRDYVEIISKLGYQEVKTYTLIKQEENILDPFELNNNINLSTYVSKEREVIRNSLAFSLLDIVKYNEKRNIQKINIFTKGMIGDGLFVYGLSSNVKSFTEMKQDIINLLNVDVSFERLEDKNYHPGLSAKIIHDKKVIGWIGKVHPIFKKADSFIAEFKMLEPIKVQFNDYDSAPLKHRDITFKLNKKEDIRTTIEKIKRFDVFNIYVKDEYEKDGINNLTIRIIANDNVVKEIDKKFNN